MANHANRRQRVQRLLDAARVLSNVERPEGGALRRRLLETSQLSAQNIELGLTRCLELEPTSEHLTQLLESTPVAPRAHVLLSANVFVAALRAIAIGVAASEIVHVRASRRDPALAEALHALAPELFELRPSLSVSPGEHLWAYGADGTIADLRASVPRGAWLHQHGAGVGAIALDARSFEPAHARDIALDTALFDQRGCLSPRALCVVGHEAQAHDIASAVAEALADLELTLPVGPQGPAEAAAARRNRDAAAYAFELFAAGSGWVTCSKTLVIPPAGRHLHVVATSDAVRSLSPFASHLTCLASNDAALLHRLGSAFSGARLAPLGEMQRPPLDGPVDRRRSPQGELL